MAVKNNKQTCMSTMYSRSSKEKPSNRKLVHVIHSVSNHKAVLNLMYVAYMFIHKKKKESHLTVLGGDR